MGTNEAPINSDGASSAAPQSADPIVAENAEKSSSFTAVLEAANDLRKMDEILEDAFAAGGSDDGVATGSPPTIEDIAEALSDGEEPIFDTVDSDSAASDDNDNGGKPAYTPQTVAAISSLIKGEESALFSQESDNGGNGGSSALAPKKITLQDRAAAMIHVYKDYIQEMDEKLEVYDEDGDGGTTRGMTDVPLADPSSIARKGEMKVATLEKFCKDAYAPGGSDEDSDDDDDDDYYSDDGGSGRVQRRNHRSLPLAPAPRTRLQEPTAATTTAAFRLKAEVALNLKAAGSKSAKVAKKAAGRVKTKVNDTMSKSSKDNQSHLEGVENDYDFQDYENNVSREYEDIQDEQQDDMEYGLTPTEQMMHDNEEGGSHKEHHSQQTQQTQCDDSDAGSAVYGLHILDRDRTLKRKSRTNDEEEALGIYSDLCDELGVTPETHPSLHYFYRTPRSTRYKYPIFRTKKFKRAMMYTGALVLFLLVAVAIVSAGSNGFEEVRRQKKDPLPDWKSDEDWRNKQKLEWEKGHVNEEDTGAVENWETDGTIVGQSNNAHDNSEHGPKVGISGQQNQGKLFQSISASYRPVWYDRSTGWTGVTYDEGLKWCDAHHGYAPCPYEVYCPYGDTLLAGVMDKDGESWAPVINEHNEWVQVGTGGACDLYNRRYGKHPEWGISGENNEAITRHIMCCRKDPVDEDSVWKNYEHTANGEHVAKPDGPPALAIPEFEAIKPQPKLEPELEQPPPPTTASAESKQQHEEQFDLEILFLSMSKKYNPIWFDRSTGWEGQTYQESLSFCAQLDEYIPCPYEVYCPGGHGKLLDGVQDQTESWAAVIDDVNDWVQVDATGECTLYSETAKELPSWGMSGEDNEEITRHIMCCHSAPHLATITSDIAENSSVEVSSDVAISNNGDMSGPPLASLPEPSDLLTELEEQIMDKYHPAWFSDQSGWKGTTHNEARAFCESLPHGDFGGTLSLCPLDAYCPNGPQTNQPLYLQMDAYEGIQWAPINSDENGWIMIGKFSDEFPLTCQTYPEINHHKPEWGVDGSSPQMKKHILCCEGDAGTEVTPSSHGVSQGVQLMDDVVVQLMPKVEPDIDDESSSTSTTSEAATTSNIVASDTSASSEQQSSSSSMTELEMQVQDELHPSWYSNEFGWQGSTYIEARSFCESIPHGEGTLHLCPLEAYCPNGARDIEPLFLQMDAFEGVQWAPIQNVNNGWVMVGDVDGLTCQSYQQINHRDPSWGLDGSSRQLKQHILCCEDSNPHNYGGFIEGGGVQASTTASSQGKVTNAVIGIESGVESADSSIIDNNRGDTPKPSQADSHSFEDSIVRTFNPTWFDVDRGGWIGGTHDDGIRFCEQFAGAHGKRMELCPYAAYCPNGPSEPVMRGYVANPDDEGEQWAPVFGQENRWVMIGKRGSNSATTCLSHLQLDGEEPSWGLDGSNNEVKKHIMCCSPLQ